MLAAARLAAEVFVEIRGKLHYLWRAVDQNGGVLDILVQQRPDTDAVKRVFRKLLAGRTDVPSLRLSERPSRL